MRAFILCLLLASFAGPAWSAAAVVNITWDAQGHFRHTSELAPGAVLEVCGSLEAGTAVDWSFAADAPLESNVHYHEGTHVVYPSKHPPAKRIEDRLVAPTKQEFCWMWRNRQAAAVILELELRR